MGISWLLVMTSGKRLYLSRDKRRGEVKNIQVWLEQPKSTNEGKSFRIYTGKLIAMISIQDAEKMGKEFMIKPGTCKPVMMHTF